MRFLFFALVTITFMGCQTRVQVQVDQDAAFGKLAEEYITGYLECRPQLGTALGFHKYDGKLTDFSKTSLEAELARLKQFEKRLDQFPVKELTPSAFYDYRILRSGIQREIFGFEEIRSFSRNPMTYAGAIDLNIYIKRNFAPFEQRVRSLVAILQQAPRVFEAARANLDEALPRPQVELAIDQANGAAEFLGGDLVTALKDLGNDDLSGQFKEANARAIEEFRSYARWLREEKLPKATNDYALGRERYSRLLQIGELVPFSPEQVFEIGMRELKIKQRTFAAAARIIDPNKAAPDVFAAIQNDHPSEKSLIPETIRDLEQIRQFVVDHNLLTMPSPVRARVVETPQYLRATGFASMDTPGPYEQVATEAYYYVTPPEPGWSEKQKNEWLTAFNYYTTDIVSIHEAYPGHYVQFLCLKTSPATKVEKIFTSYAFTEGWAHYAEQMMVDEGFGGAPSGPTATSEDRTRQAKYLLAQTDEALLRLCRLCVSIQMHCHGMTVEQGTKFFQENCYYQEKPARQEAMRGAYDPEYLYYTLGKLELFKLREDFKKQEKAKYSLKTFNDEALRNGAPPVRLLRERMLKDKAQWDKVL